MLIDGVFFMRSCLAYFVLFIVPFAASAHGSRAVNIEANSVNKMTLSSSHQETKETKRSRSSFSLFVFISLGIPRHDACRDWSHEVSL